MPNAQGSQQKPTSSSDVEATPNREDRLDILDPLTSIESTFGGKEGPLPTPSHEPVDGVESSDQEGIDMDALVVACFHESKGSLAAWPLETESVRRAIRSRLEEVLLPEIVGGEFAYWQWDLWIFCAGSRSTFVMSEDLFLYSRVLSTRMVKRYH